MCHTVRWKQIQSFESNFHSKLFWLKTPSSSASNRVYWINTNCDQEDGLILLDRRLWHLPFDWVTDISFWLSNRKFLYFLNRRIISQKSNKRHPIIGFSLLSDLLNLVWQLTWWDRFDLNSLIRSWSNRPTRALQVSLIARKRCSLLPAERRSS